MTTIGIIDDRDDDRELIAEIVKLNSESEGMNVVDNPPLRNLDEYPAWISANEICALIIDELLDETLILGEAVSYKGHNLVDFIRARYPTLPIFIITAHSNDEAVQNKFKDVERIIDRREFGKDSPKYMPIIIRSTQGYLSAFQGELRKLSDYAIKAAVGEIITPEEHDFVEAIRAKLNIAYSIEPITDISNWITSTSELMDKIEKLQKEIEENDGKDK